MNNAKEEVHQLLWELLRSKVQFRAYELYQQRGSADGADLDDWLVAEQEIVGRSMATPIP